MTTIVVSQLIAIIAALAALGAAWAMDRQGLRHADERELWRSERQLLQARALKPMPSARRPAAADTEKSVFTEEVEKVIKLAELKRLAAGGLRPLRPEEPVTHIVPTDL